jgi:DNA-directed RNA polymerase subunit L
MSSEAVRFSEYSETGPQLFSKNGQQIQASFRVAPIHVTVANVLRRQILSSVATVGFKTEPPELSDVKIQTNTAPLVNEMLMHRIGMIPVAIADPSSFVSDDYEFRINVENVGQSAVSITAADFQVYKIDSTGAETLMPNEAFFPPDPITNQTALITVLRQRYNLDTPPEKLTLKARASVGTGRTNMRYSPVSQCSYEYTRDTTAAREDALFQKWLATSKKVNDVQKITANLASELRREYDCMEIQRCYLQNEKGEPYDFTFHLESVGVFSVPTIIERGLKACEDLVAPYVALDIELPVGNLNVSINLCATRAGGYEVLFQNQEHTLGNLLQTYLVERHIEGTEMPRVKYAGYKVPHPLRQEMVVVIIPEDGLESSARKAIANVSAYLKEYFAGLSSSWQSSFEPKTVGQVTAAVPEPYTKATKAKTVKAVAEPVATEPVATAKPKTKRSTKA